ncbi:methylthioadenosine phosphorylase, putative [Trypanosoma cruzi]|uniref:Purine nucleoside phosphorylase n=3 Tax=Trypanosoma cruzi TaxID=5693 RepID=Q4DZW1_TRYCC|nr:methylthioadenosine phosphorylase, putative [Trypanosoma cruzi]PBJ71240.1 methylthioadenosine phosphorylase [Trypanosoma cruzi cruzi]EAN98076.1 methylthioadenosine phosphorylase, putative [Trypanosoma cruzi]EKG06905.1 methylthioadenosine phosphorylase, putative [Trypanosoma cruzi]KAF8284751.1 putative methylthioadenosine phosphorylase [Trypanosoma cruzi]PWU89792.1 putative methylthioadenosine phosphorylase [Trypanosoma cruzi]|eukprot:XP_819927.1 methylthioadenosine phosphorylase [Trypanosoma cruzi strain CL Brener]
MSHCSNPHGSPVLVGVFGGSGVYQLHNLNEVKYYAIDTPFGRPSGDICVAKVGGVDCAFLPRHGVGHVLNPSEVNYRANVYAMKVLGVRYLIAINAVGSLDSNYQPGDLVLVDQIIDRTTGRKSTFFENGIVAHCDFAFPTSAAFRKLARDAVHRTFPGLAAGKEGWRLHEQGTSVTMEGPQFSTKAESLMNKQLGGHLIGMTTATEAKLAREAEMAYLVIAMVTDMDAWSDAPHVTEANVRKTLEQNVDKSRTCTLEVISALGKDFFTDPAHSLLKHAITTSPSAISKEVRERLAVLLASCPHLAP